MKRSLSVPGDNMSTYHSSDYNVPLNGRLMDDFYDVSCMELAKALLGKILVRKCSDLTLIKGRIVETECYPGGDDKASFSYNGKITPKSKPMYMKPGTAFVYMTYGMYYCFNISSQGEGAVVLIRAVEPIEGIDIITKNRQAFRHKKNYSVEKVYKIHELCNGPSKFCIGFNINKDLVNEKDLCFWNEMWIEHCSHPNNIPDMNVIISKRIGIDSYGEPWASMPLRFYILESRFVSKRDRISEESMKRNQIKPD